MNLLNKKLGKSIGLKGNQSGKNEETLESTKSILPSNKKIQYLWPYGQVKKYEGRKEANLNKKFKEIRWQI